MEKGKTQTISYGHCSLCGREEYLIPVALYEEENTFSISTICPTCAKELKIDYNAEKEKLLQGEEKKSKAKKESSEQETINEEKNNASPFTCDKCGKENKDTIYFEGLEGEEKLCPKCLEKEQKRIDNIVCMEIKKKLKKPTQIIEELNKSVIGQDNAKKKLAVEIYKHFNRIVHHNSNIEKNNILLTGPSGTGKTFIIKNILEYLDIPYVIVSANSFSSTGYRGKDVQSILKELVSKAGSIFKAQYGIVFIDEVDKIKVKDTENDINGRCIQEELLTMTEGQTVTIDSDIEEYEIDTRNILFICGGAFNGIENIVKKRLKIGEKAIGFTVSPTKGNTDIKLREQINAADLESFGLIPEFIGRFPEICNLVPLTKEDYFSILIKKDGLISQYKDILKYENKKLQFEDEAAIFISEQAVKSTTGARSLKPIMNKVMQEIVFESTKTKEKKEIKITKETITQNL